MKVRPFRARVVMAGAAQGRTVLRGFRYLLRRHLVVLALVAILGVVLALLLFPHDRELLDDLHSPAFARTAVARKVASLLGFWGDYPTYNLPLAAGLWLFGVWKKSTAWRRIAVIAFLGATIAGLLDDCLRLTLGRARPDSHMPDGFYGLPAALGTRFQGFPSGHAAAVCGTAAALLVTCFPLGLATALYAACVIWARMELYHHYPSDVLVGAIIGITSGLLVGLGAKVRRSR